MGVLGLQLAEGKNIRSGRRGEEFCQTFINPAGY
jgi:hypothetical protein